MADIPDNYLLKAVDLLMGRISEQIMVLLEERARGEVDEAAFQARIRELLGTISPEVVARHPLLSAPPPPPAPEPEPEPEPGPVAAEAAEVDMASVEIVEVEIVEAEIVEAQAPDGTKADEEPSPYALIVDGVSGYDDYLAGDGADEETDLPEPPSRPDIEPGPAPEPEPLVEPEAGFVLEAEPEAEPTAAPEPEPKFLLEEEPAPAPEPAPTTCKPAPETAPAPPQARRPAPRPGAGRVMVSGRWDMDVADVCMENAAAAGRFNEDEHGMTAPPVNERQAKMLKDMAGREFQDKRRIKSPATAALLSALVAGVGDFYVGAYPSGLLFYGVYFILVVLFVLRWNYHILLALPLVCAVSAAVSHLNAGKHNDMVYALRAKPKSEQKRETHFTMH